MINLEREEMCCGCGACKSACPKNAITLICNDEGFVYPIVNKINCVECNLCITSCPIIYRENNEEQNLPINVYAAHAKEVTLWRTSSSGGVFQVLAMDIINKGGIVYGARYDANFRVSHCRVSNPTELEQLKGSKYVQSDTDGIFINVKKDLECGKLVLFSGTPCQVQGLRLYLRTPFINLITCDIVCHCVPSPMVFADYISYLQAKYKSRIIELNMKDKTLGWGKQTLRIRFENGEEIFNNSDSNLWNSIFYSHLISRPSCHECKFANVNRPGDLTIGDFWGIEKTHPKIWDSKGVSLIYVNSEKGQKALENIYEKLVLIECSLEDSIQANLDHPVTANRNRKKFWDDYKKLPFDKIVLKYFNSNSRPSFFFYIVKKALRRLKIV